MSKDSIVALTLWRGLLLLHLLIRFSQDLHLRRGICGTTLLVGKQSPEEPPAGQNDNTHEEIFMRSHRSRMRRNPASTGRGKGRDEIPRHSG